MKRVVDRRFGRIPAERAESAKRASVGLPKSGHAAGRFPALSFSREFDLPSAVRRAAAMKGLLAALLAVPYGIVPVIAMANPITVGATNMMSVDPYGQLSGQLYTVAPNQGDFIALMQFAPPSGNVASSGTIDMQVQNNFATATPSSNATPSKVETVYLYALAGPYASNSTEASLSSSGALSGTLIDSQVVSFSDGDTSFHNLSFTISQALLTSWVNSPATNYGVAIEGSPLTSYTGNNHSDLKYNTVVAPTLSFSVSVPEPMSMLLLGTGIIGLAFVRCRAVV